MFRLALAIALPLVFCVPAFAQSTGTPADHEALRKLKTDITEAVNKRDYTAAEKFLNKPFMATLITQDSFTDFDKVKTYYDGLYTRDYLRLKKVSLAAEADESSQILEGTFALTKGSTKEHYEMADGRAFDMDGRWTAVSLKKDGAWKLLAVHTGTNFLDNPVINAIEKSVVWFTAGAGSIGLIAGLFAGWFIGRRRKAA
jgi:hypothetical protein